ncbi:MAG TPA: hypothetical protein VLM91_06455 [Candidatus Methylomirabilis sp.]|nr:hypothetical protein [Candidatus Methylomirabilis sp.]
MATPQATQRPREEIEAEFDAANAAEGVNKANRLVAVQGFHRMKGDT